MKCSGSPASLENAVADGNSFFRWSSGLGLVNILTVAAATILRARRAPQRLRTERHRQPGGGEQQRNRGDSGCTNTPARQQPGKHQGDERADRRGPK